MAGEKYADRIVLGSFISELANGTARSHHVITKAWRHKKTNKQNQPSSQGLSSLSPLAVGTETLVARFWVVTWPAATRVSVPTTKGGREERPWERGWNKTNKQTNGAQ